MKTKTETAEYPAQYLHVEECRSGQEYIMPLRGNSTLDLTRLIKRWVKQEFGGELRLDGKTMPKISGDYYAAIYTDGRAPGSGVVWDAGGFYLTTTSDESRR